jgi:hydroxymethylglutaryl-CoA reductase
VLAGDISLMAAFASNEFVAVHERLSRNRPQ